MRSALYNTFAFGFLVVLGYVILFGAPGDWAATGRAGVAFLAAATCMLVGNADRFETLKASISGIEAKTREVAKVVEEARVTLKEFHVLAEMTASLLIEMTAASGRFGGSSSADTEQRRSRILSTLKAIGASGDSIRRADSADKHWVSIDYGFGVFGLISASEKCSPELKKLAADLRDELGSTGVHPGVEAFENILQAAPCDDDEVVNLIKDFRYYVETGTHRRPAVWQARGSWPH